MRLFRSAAVCLSLFAATLMMLLPAVQGEQTKQANRAESVRLSGYMPLWATSANDRGVMPAHTMKNLTVVLARPAEKEAAFEKLLDQLSTPGSPNFHHWLTQQQLGEQFGPESAQVNAVTAWLAANKLVVDDISLDRTRVTFSGASADVARTFGVGFRSYNVPTRKGDKAAIALTMNPQVPAAIAPSIASIAGLATEILISDDHAVEYPTGTNLHLMTAANFNTVYNITAQQSLATPVIGSGVRVAIIGQSRVNAQDITDYQTLMGLNVNAQPNTIIPPAGSDPGVSGPGEQTLDVNRVMSVAPGAWVDLIVSNDANSLYTAASYNVNTLLDPVMTMSYGGCEQVQGQTVVTTWTNLFQTAAAEGITVLVSSGDSGAECGNAWSNNNPNTSATNVPGTVAVFTGGAGSGAAATVTVSNAGVITGVTVTSGGSGYTSAPNIAFYSGGSNGGGSGATGIVAVVGGAVTQVLVTGGGTGYIANPTLGINWLCSNPYATCVGGTEFNDGVRVSVTPNPTGVGASALATATVSGGVITAISPTVLGTGYTSTPTVTFTGGGGTGATATATVSSGGVTSYTVTNGGSGYNTTSYWNDTGATFSTVTGYIPEGAFDETADGAGYLQVGGSDGGVSQYTSRPSFQTMTNAYLALPTGTVNGVNTAGKRLVPDIALAASGHDGYFQCINLDCESGKYSTEEGTSAAAPSFAGIVAMGVQKFGKQGSLNNFLYKFSSLGAYNTAYHDITPTSAGVTPCVAATPSLCNNSEPYLTGYTLSDYTSTGGYDMVTGIGSVNVSQLMGANWNNPSYGGNGSSYTSTTATFGTQSGIAYPATVATNLNATAKAGVTDVTAMGTLFYTATSSASGAAPVAVTASSVLVPGTYTLRAFWQPTAANAVYNISSATGGSFTVGKATPTISNVTQTVPASGSSIVGAAVTFVATVSGVTNGGTPTGTVQFYNGSTAIGSPVTLASGVATLSTYTFTAAGPASITATYSGDTNYASGATSATALSVTVIAPSLTITANPNTLTITRGNTGTSVITFTPTGGYTGSATMTCTGMPAYSSCGFNPSTVTFTGNGAVQTSTLTVYTLAGNAAPGASSSALLWIPGILCAVVLFVRRRKITAMTGGVMMLVMLTCVALGMSGCGHTSYGTPVGTQTVQVNVAATATAGSGSSNLNQSANITITIQ